MAVILAHAAYLEVLRACDVFRTGSRCWCVAVLFVHATPLEVLRACDVSCTGLRCWCVAVLFVHATHHQGAAYALILTYIIHVSGWPEPYTSGVFTVLSGKSPNIRSYMVYEYGSGLPYSCCITYTHCIHCIHGQANPKSMTYTQCFCCIQGCVIRSFGTFNTVKYVFNAKNTYNTIVFLNNFGSADF